MYPNQPIDPELIDLLYRVVESLERAWEGAGLPDDLGSRVIAAVLRHLHKRGRNLDPRSPEERAGLAVDAVRLLRFFWKRNARRDADRAGEARQENRLPVVSLDALVSDAGTPSTGLYADDLRGGDTGLALIDELERMGYPPERAHAVMWRSLGRDWDDVQYLLEKRFGCRATLPQLRQWGNRYNKDTRDNIRKALFDADGSEPPAPPAPPSEPDAADRHRRRPQHGPVATTRRQNPLPTKRRPVVTKTSGLGIKSRMSRGCSERG